MSWRHWRPISATQQRAGRLRQFKLLQLEHQAEAQAGAGRIAGYGNFVRGHGFAEFAISQHGVVECGREGMFRRKTVIHRVHLAACRFGQICGEDTVRARAADHEAAAVQIQHSAVCCGVSRGKDVCGSPAKLAVFHGDVARHELQPGKQLRRAALCLGGMLMIELGAQYPPQRHGAHA